MQSIVHEVKNMLCTNAQPTRLQYVQSVNWIMRWILVQSYQTLGWPSRRNVFYWSKTTLPIFSDMYEVTPNMFYENFRTPQNNWNAYQWASMNTWGQANWSNQQNWQNPWMNQ